MSINDTTTLIFNFQIANVYRDFRTNLIISTSKDGATLIQLSLLTRRERLPPSLVVNTCILGKIYQTSTSSFKTRSISTTITKSPHKMIWKSTRHKMWTTNSLRLSSLNNASAEDHLKSGKELCIPMEQVWERSLPSDTAASRDIAT